MYLVYGKLDTVPDSERKGFNNNNQLYTTKEAIISYRSSFPTFITPVPTKTYWPDFDKRKYHQPFWLLPTTDRFRGDFHFDF